MSTDRNLVLTNVTEAYLGSPDFNGIPIASLVQRTKLDWPSVRQQLIALVEDNSVGVIFSDTDENPHILRYGFEAAVQQVNKLEAIDDLAHACVYPTEAHLSSLNISNQYDDRPFDLELAMGRPQLSPRFFDLSVLEIYRNDPRYLYQTNDVGGSIAIRDEYYESEGVPERDQVLLQTFGFAYDDDFSRVVAVYLRYLADLSPEHQRIWKARELTGGFKLHPDYYRNTILGQWGERESIFTALLLEQYIINQMARAMGRPSLFRNDYGEYAEGRPRQLSFLVRPTLEEFNAFILLLDKLLSENINKAFFGDEVPREEEFERPDGRVEVRQRGTLVMLDEWMRKKVRLDDWEDWDQAISALREVRKLRQKPAHAVNENVFDQAYFKKQRDLVVRIYTAVRTLRLLLANHPATADVKVPEWLYQGMIWDF